MSKLIGRKVKRVKSFTDCGDRPLTIGNLIADQWFPVGCVAVIYAKSSSGEVRIAALYGQGEYSIPTKQLRYLNNRKVVI